MTSSSSRFDIPSLHHSPPLHHLPPTLSLAQSLSRRFLLLLPFLLLCVVETTPAHAHAAHPDLLDVPQLSFLQHAPQLPNLPVTRMGFASAPSVDHIVVLMQENGYVDFATTYWLTIPESISIDNVTFFQSCTDSNVLNVSSNASLAASSSAAHSLNVTVPLSFDSMVGPVNYTLTAIRSDTDDLIDSITIRFLIVGVTFYRVLPTGDIEIISGDENEWSLSYQQAMSTTVSWQATIRVFIQYGDGTNSTVLPSGLASDGDDLSVTFHNNSGEVGQTADGDGTNSTLLVLDLLPNGGDLSMTYHNITGELVHDANACDVDAVATMPDSGELQTSAGCGCGFYFAPPNLLSFGCAFQPFRTGEFKVHITWPGITWDNPALSGDVFELPLNINVTGIPPVAVVGIYPSTMLRPEGGEIRTLYIINSHLHGAVQFEIRVDTIDDPFLMIPGSYESISAPNYTNVASFLTQPGNGSDLNWKLYYLYPYVSDNTTEYEYKEAACVSTLSHVFSYDRNDIRLDSISPLYGSDTGGETITLKGYFPNFDKDRDGVYFSGYKLNGENIVSASHDTVVFTLPPRSELGSSYEHHVIVKIGFASTEPALFSYYVYDADLRVAIIGASDLSNGISRMGDCSSVRFMAIVSPLTQQILSYEWVLQSNSSVTGNLLTDSTQLQRIDSLSSSIELNADLVTVGIYSLKVTVTMLKVVLKAEVLFMRESVLSIGVTILHPQNRTLSNPDAPLRLSALVSIPDCYNGNNRIMYQWEGFGTGQEYSSANGTSVTVGAPTSGAVARLGWEFFVPTQSLSIGSHDVVFTAWIEGENPPITGQASATVHILQSSLVAVIRSGETHLIVNYLTTLHLYSNISYDPDVQGLDRGANLIYEWDCRQSATVSFDAASSSPCIPALIPDNTVAEFVVPMWTAGSQSNVSFLQYSLIVRKGSGRVSKSTSLIIEIQNQSPLPHLVDYKITLTNGQGTALDWNGVYHFQDVVIHVNTESAAKWKYECLHPAQIDFFSAHNLIGEEGYYASPTTIVEASGTTKPLGIRANALNAATTYTFKISFEESAGHAATDVLVQLRTHEIYIVNMPTPVVTNGTTETTFVLTAGTPYSSHSFSFYFIITDLSGNEICAGGCTGYDISQFTLNRAGNYSISVLLYDSLGTAQVSSAHSLSQLSATSSDSGLQYQVQLNTLFAEGNDQEWLMLAQDIIIMLLEGNFQFTRSGGPAEEDHLAVEMDFALNIATNSSKLFCNTFPNTLHGRECISLVYRLSLVSLLDLDTIYYLMQTATCCVKNTPPRTVKDMLPWFAQFIKELNRLTKALSQGGNSRRRLVHTSGEPANAFADVQIWTGEMMADVATSGRVDGFSGEYLVGDNETVGHVSITLGSKQSDMPADVVNGISRYVVKGPSQNELFFPRDGCSVDLFGSAKRVVVVLHTTDNFVVYGFQDAPERSNLVDRLYWTRVYSVDDDWKLEEIPLQNDGYCFCWRLPVVRLQDELATSVDDMPGLFGVTEMKKFREDVTEKGAVFNYDYDGSKTSEYNTTEGWVEGCRGDVGLVSTTVVSKVSQNIIAEGNVAILGKGAWAIVAFVVGALLLVMVAVIASWLVAVNTMAQSPLLAAGDGEAYVERDVYGRNSAMTDANMERMRSN